MEGNSQLQAFYQWVENEANQICAIKAIEWNYKKVHCTPEIGRLHLVKCALSLYILWVHLSFLHFCEGNQEFCPEFLAVYCELLPSRPDAEETGVKNHR